MPRDIFVFVRDRNDLPLAGATVTFSVNGLPAGEVAQAEGRGSIHLENSAAVVSVTASYTGLADQSVVLAPESNAHTFKFDVDAGPSTVSKHIPLIVGIGFLLLALALGFTFSSPTLLQTRLILVVASLGGGLVASEIPGMLNVNLTFGKRVAIGATGALAVFVILYFMLPAM